MSSTRDRIKECLRDIDPDFVQSLAIAQAWEYDRLYEELRDDPDLTDGLRKEEFNRRRSLCSMRAMCRIAKRHGVPYEFRRLECNGQRKILLKIGRVALIQEPILFVGERPNASQYKIELADAHGIMRQLDLDLGDKPHQVHDWDGCILGVLLHGSTGHQFSRTEKSLGSLMLGVPDAGYSQWEIRLDLHRIAMEGLDRAVEFGDAQSDYSAAQSDKVRVRIKTKKVNRKGV